MGEPPIFSVSPENRGAKCIKNHAQIQQVGGCSSPIAGRERAARAVGQPIVLGFYLFLLEPSTSLQPDWLSKKGPLASANRECHFAVRAS
jgi:hypothetical protein